MEQPIQLKVEGAVGNLRQQLYMSWGGVLLNGLLAVIALLILLLASLLFGSMEGLFFAIVFFGIYVVILLILVTASILGSFAKKHKGYLNTKFVDLIFVVPALGVLVATFPLLREDLFIASNGYYTSTFISDTWPFYISIALVIILAICLNHIKFQKREDGIGTLK